MNKKNIMPERTTWVEIEAYQMHKNNVSNNSAHQRVVIVVRFIEKKGLSDD